MLYFNIMYLEKPDLSNSMTLTFSTLTPKDIKIFYFLLLLYIASYFTFRYLFHLEVIFITVCIGI